MSINSKVSRNLSMKSRNTVLVIHRKSTKRGVDPTAKVGDNLAMERIAVTLRQKQEYQRAEKLLLKAI